MEELGQRTILVTGGTGFVGSHLVEALIKKKARVIVTYRSLVPQSYFMLRNLHRFVTLASCDLNDQTRVFDVIIKYEIDIIFHLAAQPIVTTAYVNPLETLSSNILGTAHLLEAARHSHRVRNIIITSSDKAYGKSQQAVTEESPLKGDHPYEVSKIATDLVAQAYSRTYNLPLIIVRFGNIYGPGDLNYSRIIPAIMQAALTQKKLIVRSDGSYIRDYIYVKDVVSAYLFLLHNFKKAVGEAYNIASYDTMSVLELIKKARTILHKKFQVQIANQAVNEIPYQHLEWKKIARLGWKSQYSLTRGLKESYKWYKNHQPLFFKV